MGIHEIQEEREGSYTRRIAHPRSGQPTVDSEQAPPNTDHRPLNTKHRTLPRGFTDRKTYMAMMHRLNRSKHKKEFKHWGPGK